MYNFHSSLENFHSNLWHHHIPVPDAIAVQLIEGDNRRVIITLNGSITWQAALMKSESYWFVLINKENLTKLGAKEGTKIEVQLEKDRTEYGLPITDEMQTLMEQDEEGAAYFRQLTMGKQRSLIYIAGQVKNTHSRLNRALAIFHHLKEYNGRLDFKILNETIKAYNQQNKLKK
ncbi:DUF1905 domain-containing protein [Cytophagales bacterium LB-30]|uniref:DUF1905 domain-containing protein n=1 Tax=Shiella aurantiaca TaxID=3058365 RepID=A0ABT8F1X0_9BACT|nr:DUF1905 domain-containing protein [Shiella aurantiaca]MDN4164244.1 DUF1905 domain-containing protein [Shiella aurantiaca]